MQTYRPLYCHDDSIGFPGGNVLFSPIRRPLGMLYGDLVVNKGPKKTNDFLGSS